MANIAVKIIIELSLTISKKTGNEEIIKRKQFILWNIAFFKRYSNVRILLYYSSYVGVNE